MKKAAMMVAAVLLSAGMFADSANLSFKFRKGHGTSKTATKKDESKKAKTHAAMAHHHHAGKAVKAKV